MATALFISRTDLVKNSIIDGNVDTDKFIQFIKISQEIHIQNYLGGKLYDKISDEIVAGTLSGNYLTLVTEFVQPILIHYAMVDYLPFAAYQVKNGGVFKHNSENAQTASKDEVDFLVSKERDFAEHYCRRFIDYMCYHGNLYPEYTNNSEDDVRPSKNTNPSNWVL